MYDGTSYVSFRDTAEFVAHVSSIDCIVYAHNGGKFDWHFILGHLEAWEPLMVINGRLAKFRIGKAEFRDSYNIMPMPLSAYKKDEVDYTIFEAGVREKPENMALIEAYLRNDCIYLHEMVTAFIEEFGLHLTQAGASMKAWERIADREAPSTSKEFYAELSPYYYGGRVQCFKLGTARTEFKIIDINSAYPDAMMHDHPYGDTIQTVPYLPTDEGEIERCFVHLRARSLGAFPLRGNDGSLNFPDDGELRTFWVTGWEYLAARDTGCLVDAAVISCKVLGETIEYSAYLNHFYKMKTDAGKTGANPNKARYEFAKRFLNSLYGKNGSNPENYEEFTCVPPRYIDAASEADGYGYVTDLGPYALMARPLPEERQRYYNVAVAASVTGFVRAKLWRAAKQCTGVLYCDTDCLWVTTTGDLELDPEKLGMWDVEAECTFAALAGKKMYAALTTKVDPDTGRLVWKTASKGVRLGVKQLIRVARGKSVRYSPMGPTYSAKRGVRFTPRTVSRSAAQIPHFDKETDHGQDSEDPFDFGDE